MNNNKENKTFYQTNAPIKLTEGRKLKLHTIGWGLLTEYYIESVKINHYKKDKLSSVATLRITDGAGHIACVVKGLAVGLLFGLSQDEWREVECLCGYQQQLFYRYFKNGIVKSAPFEQKLFYNFCLINQSNSVLVAKFKRCINVRNKFKNEALLDIVELKQCNNHIMDLYINSLRKQS
ncbi:hypothetical protein O3G_MSEX006135 [Manduca sexta]|uniref:Uncharacterized protein n=1 Tax=Manduca sexta TaxID=7130 RepID=A0A921Z2C1_MANSE|nr:hypothetical protein O3G_MSEX006135 [Manduca sexta]